MDNIVRKLSFHPSVVLSGMVLLGVLEFVALQRSQRGRRSKQAEQLQ